jgi:DNA-binding CsgD family transcriptional regulator
MDAMKTSFGSRGGAAIIFGSPATEARTVLGICDGDLDEYERVWYPQDAMARCLAKRGVPIHNRQVFTPEEQLRDPVQIHFGERIEAWHVMMAPIYGSRGHLDGVFIQCRPPRERAYGEEDLALAGAFSGLLSATLARVRHGGDPPPDQFCHAGVLTRRELQIAQRVAAGRSNLEAGFELGVARETVKQALRRVYAKLDVSGRAQMAATLAARGMLGN